MQKTKAALHRGHDNSAKQTRGRTIPQSQIVSHTDFIKGSYGACALMCAMFVILTLGAVFLGW